MTLDEAMEVLSNLADGNPKTKEAYVLIIGRWSAALEHKTTGTTISERVDVLLDTVNLLNQRIEVLEDRQIGTAP